VIYLILKGIDWLFSVLYKVIKNIWKLIKEIKLSSIALLISLIINLCLVWFGALGLEFANRPVVYPPKALTTNPSHSYHFNNSGRSFAHLEVEAQGTTSYRDLSGTLKLIKSNLQERITARAYPNQSRSFTWRTLDTLFSYPPPDSEIYLTKIAWQYESFFPDIIPGIHDYRDSIYLNYDTLEKEWKESHVKDEQALLDSLTRVHLEKLNPPK